MSSITVLAADGFASPVTRRAVIYSTETGDIVAFRSGRIETIELDILEGQSYLLTEEEPTSLKDKHVVNGALVPLSTEVLESRDTAAAWKKLRARRNRQLYSSDWTQAPDSPVDSAAWATYRQQLRDLPANTTDPRDVTWPVPPS